MAPILDQVDSPLTFTLAMLFGELWIAAFVTLILSFVTGGRLASTVDVVLVWAFFVGLFVVQFAVMLFLEDEDNLLLVWPDAGIASALDKVQLAVLSRRVARGRVRDRRAAGARPRGRAAERCCRASAAALCGVLYAAWLTSSSWSHPWCRSSGS